MKEYLEYLKSQNIDILNKSLDKFEKGEITIRELEHIAMENQLWQMYTFIKSIKIRRILEE